MSTKESKTREAICALGAKLAARGLCPGTSGNISARIDDGWLMTPTNSSLGELEPGQLSKLDLSGKHPGGEIAELVFHSLQLAVRPRASGLRGVSLALSSTIGLVAVFSSSGSHSRRPQTTLTSG